MAVVVPCFNYGVFLRDCVSSVVNQIGVSTEVHIIDDASTDGSDKIAEEIADQNVNVRLTIHERNVGHIATYNEGLRQVDSDYLVLLSADDMLPPGSLARATSLMEHHPTVGLTYGHPQAFTTVPTASSDRVRSWSVWSGERWIRKQFRRALGIISSPEAVVRTSIQHEVGYYRTSLPHSGDLEMWLRIADVAAVGRVNGPDQAYRRMHSASMMAVSYGTLLQDLGERRKAYDSFLRASMLPEAAKSELRARVYSRMSNEALEWAVGAACRVGGTPADVLPALELAGEFNPAYEASSAYQDFVWSARLSGVRPRMKGWPLALQGRVARQVGPSFRWRRWRRYGY